MERATMLVINESSHIHCTLTTQNLISDYSVDISVVTQVMFIYLDILHCQIVSDIKAIDTNR